MSKISLHIVYNSDIGRPLTAARIDDTDLIVQVANRAIERAKREATAVESIDLFVGQVKHDEAAKLESVLKTLIPETDHDLLSLIHKKLEICREINYFLGELT